MRKKPIKLDGFLRVPSTSCERLIYNIVGSKSENIEDKIPQNEYNNNKKEKRKKNVSAALSRPPFSIYIL